MIARACCTSPDRWQARPLPAGQVILAEHGQTRHPNIGEARRPRGSGPCGVTVGPKRFSASPRPSTPSRRLGEVTGRPLSLAVLTEGGHDLLRELADQAELVVEVDAHPELTRPGLDRALELLDAVGRGAHDGKSIREVVEEPELG